MQYYHFVNNFLFQEHIVESRENKHDHDHRLDMEVVINAEEVAVVHREHNR